MTVSDRASIEEAYADLDEVLGRIAGVDYTALTVPELLELQSRRERLLCAAAAVDHQILAALQSQTTPKAVGAKNWAEVLRIRLRISSTEARRRLRDAALLGPRRGLTGEPLEPVYPEVAAAQAAGVINPGHVTVIADFFTDVPAWVDPATRTQCEQDLVAKARHSTPEQLKAAADETLFLLDQDGPEPDDTEPPAQRGITVGKQQPDSTSPVSGSLTPEARALFEAWMVTYSALGMCNPADPDPCISGTPTQEQIDNDHRTPAQRRHDAFVALTRLGLSTQPGTHNGFPVTIVATCTLEQLEQRAGVALTHTGTRLPVKDLLNLAAQHGADHYLSVFDNHHRIPLHLGRARRTASTGQRLALFARDRGCTHPHCTQPAAQCQAHHAVTDWQHGGNTDITDLTLACGPHNRLVDTGRWTTTMTNGQAHWTPPPLLDVGQPRTNQYHHPTLYPPENDGDGDGDSETDSAAS